MPELNNRMGPFPCAGVHEADRLHGAVGEGLLSPLGHLLDGETSLEVDSGFKIAVRNLLTGEQFRDKAAVFLLVQGTVQVVASLAVSRGPEGNFLVYALSLHNGG